MLVNNFQFNKNALMALVASHNKSFDYNLLHNKMRHLTVHALKQIMKYLDSIFNFDQKLQLKFCGACQLG